VWNKGEQWEPLWNDIADKAEMRSKGEMPSPHFLGAIVLEPRPRRGLRGAETYHIIDGQQRLTTLQYLLAAIAMAARETDQTALLHLIDGCVWNPNPETMENADVERFKVWPTFRDRIPYQTARVISRQASRRRRLSGRSALSIRKRWRLSDTSAKRSMRGWGRMMLAAQNARTDSRSRSPGLAPCLNLSR
jgi:hypothetical protein